METANIISKSRQDYKRFEDNGTLIRVEIKSPPAGENPIAWVEKAMRDLVERLMVGVLPHHQVGATFII